MSEQIVTERLVLEPLSQETARAVVEGEPDGLARGEGWPHEDTLDALGMVAAYGSEAWLIYEAGLVIGDAGTHGPPDEDGDVEIGYGIAEPARGRGLASEFVPALAQHVLARPEVSRVVARAVLADNVLVAPRARACGVRAGARGRQPLLVRVRLETVDEQPDLPVRDEAEPLEHRPGHRAGLDDQRSACRARRRRPSGRGRARGRRRGRAPRAARRRRASRSPSRV